MSMRSTLRWLRVGLVAVLSASLSMNSAGAWGWLRCRSVPVTGCPTVVVECPTAPATCVESPCAEVVLSHASVGCCGETVVEPVACCDSLPVDGCAATVVAEPMEGCCGDGVDSSGLTAPLEMAPMEAGQPTPAITEKSAPVPDAAAPATPMPADPMSPEDPMGTPDAAPASSDEPAPMAEPAEELDPMAEPEAEATSADGLLDDPGLTADPDSPPAADAPVDAAPGDAAPADDAPADAFDFGSEPAADAPAAGAESTGDDAAAALPEADAPAAEAPEAAAPAEGTAPDGLDSFDFGDGEAPAETPPAAESDAPAGSDPLDGLGQLPRQTPNRLVSVREQHLPRRFWSDTTGQFHTAGQLVDVGPGVVRLLKDNGRFSTVAIAKLSRIDRAYVRAVQTGLTSSISIAAN